MSTIRTYLDAGLSTAVIRDILPCASGGEPSSTACPDLLARVMAIRDGLEERAARITTQRDWPMRCIMPKTFSPVLDVIASLCSHLAT